MLNLWSGGPKLCSQKREAWPCCALVQCQKPQIFLVLQILQHNLLYTGKISLIDVLSTAQRRRLAWWWALWEPEDRQQQEQGGIGRECVVTVNTRHVFELCGEHMGLKSARNVCGCKRLRRRCCTRCAICGTREATLCWWVLTWTIMYRSGSAKISVGFSAVTTKVKNDFALPIN